MMAKHIQEKYQGFKPAAIYVTDDNALVFALYRLSMVFPDVPVFFSGVNDYNIKADLDPARVTGIFEKKEIAPNLTLMERIDPTVREIVVIGDASSTSVSIEGEIRKEMTRYPDIRASYISKNRIDDLIHELKKRKERFLFLGTLGAVKDNENRTLSLAETIGAIVNAGRFEVFSMEDAYLYPGVLGGYVTSGSLQGKSAAQLLQRYLNGTPMSALAPVEASPNEYILNEAELIKAGYSLPKNLAGKVTLINTVPNYYESNRSVILGTLYGLASLLFISLAISLFLVLRKNRQIALSSLKIAEVKERLDRAQNIAHTGSWTVDMASQLMWSDELYRIFGVSPETFIPNTENFIKLIYPDDQPAMQAWIDACISGRQPGALEFRCVRPDGAIRYIKGEGEMIFDAEGKPSHLSGIAQDITEHKKSENKIIESQRQLSALITNLPGMVYRCRNDECWTLEFVSEGCLDLTGYSVEDFVVHRTVTYGKDIIHPNDQKKVWDAVQTALDDKRPYIIIYRILTADKQEKWAWEQGSGVFGADGELQALEGFITDITERKRAEELAQQIGNLLQASFNEIFIFDAVDLHFIQVSEGAQNNLGYSYRELEQLTPVDIKPLFTLESFEQTIAPLRSGQEQLLFFETIHRRKDGTTYPVEIRLQLMQKPRPLFMAIIQDISESKAAEENIRHLAFFDPLTHLPNRRLLMDRMKQSLASSERSGRKGALLFIDLDNFKTLNDTLGHDIGDLLLQQVANNLISCVRDGDTVARLGGDEFVVILEVLSEDPLQAAAQTKVVGEKILATLNQSYQLAKHGYHSTASIGATMFNGEQTSTEELMKQADIAMYQAKNAGRNTMLFFDIHMQDSVNINAALEGDLRNALENRQFHLHYQIQMDSSRRPLGAEALIRWPHPERGLISPAQFIPVAEENGMILPIGQWVLETACAQLKIWQSDDLASGFVLAVNVSARQFRQVGFVAQVQTIVQRHAIKPWLLKLELTEGMLLENIEDTIKTMNALKEIGIQFSLDDFGTGYSSLQYLKRLPLDQLKIDQSFVRDIVTDISDMAIVRTIIGIAHSLNLDVIAEGVETEEQRQLLLDSGCTHYQGYLFGKPLPIEQFEVLLKQS